MATVKVDTTLWELYHDGERPTGFRAWFFKTVGSEVPFVCTGSWSAAQEIATHNAHALGATGVQLQP